MKLVVRAALESNAEEINKVSRYLGYSEVSASEARSKLQELLISPQDQVFVSEVDGQIVGWLHIFRARRLASENFYEIGGLVVAPDARGHGIGRGLVEHALDHTQGKVRVRCNELRVESHQFYEAIGFGSTKVQRVFERR